jgi:hypothetical protein
MTKQWNDVFALARKIENAIAEGATIDTEKARRLARTLLALDRVVRLENRVQLER